MKGILIFIMGDFNALVGIIGEQGLIIMGKLQYIYYDRKQYDPDKCTGTYTWSRVRSKGVIYFIIVNYSAFGIYDKEEIEEQEQFYFIYHNLIEIILK